MGILWLVGALIVIALLFVVVIGIVRFVVKAAFSILGIAALIWLVLFLLNVRIW